MSELTTVLTNNATIERLIEFCDQQNKKCLELMRWKKEAMEVESTWDEQAVAEELGLDLGDSIRPQILPKIKELKTNLAVAHEATKPLVDALSGIAGLCQTTIRYPDIFVKDVFKICEDALARLK